MVVVAIAAVGSVGIKLILSELQRDAMQDNPGAVFRHHGPELLDYGRRLTGGEVRYVEGRGYALPQFLIDAGARYAVIEGDAFVVGFGFMPTDAVPELWFSPKGFEPWPTSLAERRRRNSFFRFQQLAPNWGECYWDN